MRVLFAISLIAILFALVSAQTPTYAPTFKPSTYKPSNPSFSPTRKPTQKPTRAKYIYKTTEEEATANVAWSAVIGTLGFIGKNLLECFIYLSYISHTILTKIIFLI